MLAVGIHSPVTVIMSGIERYWTNRKPSYHPGVVRDSGKRYGVCIHRWLGEFICTKESPLTNCLNSTSPWPVVTSLEYLVFSASESGKTLIYHHISSEQARAGHLERVTLHRRFISFISYHLSRSGATFSWVWGLLIFHIYLLSSSQLKWRTTLQDVFGLWAVMDPSHLQILLAYDVQHARL